MLQVRCRQGKIFFSCVPLLITSIPELLCSLNSLFKGMRISLGIFNVILLLIFTGKKLNFLVIIIKYEINNYPLNSRGFCASVNMYECE